MFKVGSLCTGYGGLDLAVEDYYEAEMVWCAEIDKYASRVIEERFNKPNLGDIKKIKWDQVEPIDILTAGYPCQPFSHAGYRKGIEDERHIWPFIKEAISNLRPSVVVMENVRGHLTLGFDRVLADLTEIGYNASWEIVRASDVGAPHQRARLFIIAYPDGNARTQSRRADKGLSTKSQGLRDGQDERQTGDEYRRSFTDSDTNHQYQPYDGQVSQFRSRFTSRCEMHVQSPPDALVEGKLNARFVEYMMGLPEGWVTDIGLSNAQTLKMLGNGVVPQQAYYALELLNAMPSDLR
jgi:DNA (cytosine-5)-methyltransferase 1